ncbi:hypothetical protein D7003_02420, partial [Arthrobacter oryzae]
MSSRIQARPVHRVRDVPCGGSPVEVRVRKRRLACLEPQCPRRSFVQTTDEIPAVSYNPLPPPPQRPEQHGGATG